VGHGSRRIGLVASLMLSMAVPSVQSAVIFNDGGTHALSSVVNDDVWVSDGTRLNIEGRAEVHGTGSGPGEYIWPGGGAVSVQPPDEFPNGVGLRNVIKVSGDARILPDENQAGIMVSNRAPADIRLSGDAYVGGAIASPYSYGSLGDGSRNLSISGNAVVDGDVYWGGHINISDNAFVNGGIFDEYAHFQLDMSGGQVRDNLWLASAGEYVVNLKDGSLLGGLTCWSSSVCTMQMRGGSIGPGSPGAHPELMQGVLSNRSAFDFTMSGGVIEGGIIVNGQYADLVQIFGGQIDALPGGWLFFGDQTQSYFVDRFSEFNIYGGQFGYLEQGLGWFFDGYTNLNVYGWDLAYSGGRLTGYLSDGNYVDVALTFGEDWNGSLNMIRQNSNVPAPGPLGLFGVGIAGLALRTRRKPN
jgi:PEP-CTERM motif